MVLGPNDHTVAVFYPDRQHDPDGGYAMRNAVLTVTLYNDWLLTVADASSSQVDAHASKRHGG
jgi:hypothetical protein